MAQRLALHAGFGCIILLTAGVAVFSLVESHEAEAETRQIVFESEREAYLIGHIGQQISRVRAETLETLTEPLSTIGPLLTTIALVNRSLDEELIELPPLVSSQEAPGWRTLEPHLVALRTRLAEALQDVKDGKPDDAERVLDVVVADQAAISLSMQEFFEVAHADTQRAIDVAEGRLERTRRLEMLAFLVLFLSTAGIWAAVQRIIRRQQSSVASHITRIESANLDLEAFAGRVAHDLKNIIAPIAMAPTMLRRSSEKPEAISAIADRVERSSRRAVNLLEGLLAFARAGAPADASEEVVLKDELDAVLDELAASAERVNASVNVDVDRRIVLACPPPLLHVVLLNLIANAVKFLEGRPLREVHVRAFARGSFCEINVEDTGPGIPRGVRERIFEPFYRAPGVTTAGAGIGLATVRRVVDAFGGSVDVDSVEGHGATFRVRLPLARAEASINAGEAAHATSPTVVSIDSSRPQKKLG